MSLLLLKNLPFFQPVPAKILEVWLRSFTPPVRNHPKGTIVAFQGQEYRELLFILSGQVDAEIQDYGGKTLKVETLAAPEPIAAAILFAPEKALPVTITAATDVKIIAVPREQVLRLCRISEDFLLSMLTDMGTKIAFLAQKLRFLQFGTIKRKIAGFLLEEMSRQRSAVLTVPQTKEVLSEIFGVTRPALSRVFSELCREKIIGQEGRTIRVLKPARLREMMEEEG